MQSFGISLSLEQLGKSKQCSAFCFLVEIHIYYSCQVKFLVKFIYILLYLPVSSEVFNPWSLLCSCSHSLVNLDKFWHCKFGNNYLFCPVPMNPLLHKSCTVGVALPVYSTFKAIEKKDQNEQEKWLLYWAAYGSFSLVELFSDKILSWFPLYYHVKFAFLVWLQLPSNNGARHLYERYLRPFLLRHQARLDRLLSYASCEIAKVISNHQEEILFLRSLVGKCAATANQMLKDIIQPAHPPAQNSIQQRSNGPVIEEIEETNVH